MADETGWPRRTPRRDEITEILPVVGDDDTGALTVAADDEGIDGQTDLEHDIGDPPDARTRGATEEASRDARTAPRATALLAGAVRMGLSRLGSVILAWLRTVLLSSLPRLGKATLRRSPRLAAALGAGALLRASFPSVNWWWAAVVAFALLSWVLTRPATTVAGGFGYGYLCGLSFYLSLLPWIGTLVGAVPLVALVALCAVFPGIFGLSAVVVRRLPGWPIWFALLWAVQEWLKCTVPFGGFPWGVVAQGQTDGPFLPLARLGGVPLLSTAIVLIGCSVTAIALEIVSWWRRGPRIASGSGAPADAGPPPAVVLPGLCICVVLLLSIIVWPQARRSGIGSGNDPSVTAAAVQGNVPRLGFDFNAQRLAVLRNHVRETLRLADDIRAGVAPQPQFVVWPEDATEIDPLLNSDAAQQITAAADAIRAPILVGALTDVPGTNAGKPAYRNTVIVWNPRTGAADRHDKQIVQPFGEYLPWRGFFRHLTALADMASNIVPGESTGVVRAAGIPIGVATCWEVVFDRALRESVRNGAQVLTVPANNANFNQTMSEQQLAFSKIRAVENDRYVIVASNTGISAVIAPDGRELARTQFFVPTYLDTQVRLKTTLTPAGRWGPAGQGLLVVSGAAALLVAVRHNRWFPRLNRRRFRSVDESDAPSAGSGDDKSSGAGEPEVLLGETGHQTAPEDDTPPEEGGRHSAGRHRGAT
ncbi:apolipoprotein N-acyltransferase [Mycobacterium botniense]|uniref:Apolipoprotein N-acyltransferase n=1 Tax=Mycobacterium botniense TaxID=84962 RepID=A0A7I9Y161_9MYCO|nr:apolipoprotein N-acyltransferase [Mycobacterium botniense]GFG75801.1 hypothetical protein MBOT_31660 [Mycobacterium botniense]